ncbi:MAG: methyltransferase family protein [Promethearchaeota archaeon]
MLKKKKEEEDGHVSGRWIGSRIAGVGVEFTIPVTIYGITTLIVNYLVFPKMIFTLGSPIVNILLGAFVIFLGIATVRKALIILPYIEEKKLCTEGIYAKIRNPIYFAWILLIIPGLIIMTGLYLGFTIPFFMYGVFRIFIPREEEYLERLFGEDYLTYKKSTGRLFLHI